MTTPKRMSNVLRFIRGHFFGFSAVGGRCQAGYSIVLNAAFWETSDPRRLLVQYPRLPPSAPPGQSKIPRRRRRMRFSSFEFPCLLVGRENFTGQWHRKITNTCCVSAALVVYLEGRQPEMIELKQIAISRSSESDRNWGREAKFAT